MQAKISTAQRRSTYGGTADWPAAKAAVESYPTLCTRRFRFRPFLLTDIKPLAALAGEHRVADTFIGIPHPYTMEFARLWIASHSAAWAERRELHWAALKGGEDRLVGYAGLSEIDMEQRQAELRFWVGRGVERKRDAVEWSAALVRFALTDLKLNRVYALQLCRHALAGHVHAAVGMRREGVGRQRIVGGLVEDVVCWVITRSDA